MTIPSGFGQASFLMSGSGLPRRGLVAIGFVNTAAMTALEAAEAISGAFSLSNMPGPLSSAVQVDGVRVKLGPDATGPAAEISTFQPGETTGASVPPNVAGLVKKFTNDGGRRGRGRSFWPGVPELEVSQAGILSAPWRGSFQTVCTDFLSRMATLGLQMAVLHDSVMLPSLVVSYQVDSRVATQRDRLR
jgi:hypothetical protein